MGEWLLSPSSYSSLYVPEHIHERSAERMEREARAEDARGCEMKVGLLGDESERRDRSARGTAEMDSGVRLVRWGAHEPRVTAARGCQRVVKGEGG